MKVSCVLAIAFLFLIAGSGILRGADVPPAPSKAPEPEEIQFSNGGATLHGFIYKPSGNGPFPAVLYNHGSDKKPGWFPELAQFWTSHGFVFFVPHRQGHGRSSDAGPWIVDLQEQFRDKEKDLEAYRKHVIKLHEKANEDVVAAVAWLKKQSYVKPDAIVMSGISYGGIQTVLASEKKLGMKAYVSFSPAAMSWAGNPPLRERLLKALQHATAPVFLLQAKNDYNLGPTELLGAELKRQGPPNRSALYPAFGKADDPKDGHGGFAVRGSAVWGDEVLQFVNAAIKE